MAIYRKDLVDVGDEDYKERQGEFLMCPTCFLESGGTSRGDLWDHPMDFRLCCPECGGDFMLVKARREIDIIKK